jgi:hypothetical protein
MRFPRRCAQGRPAGRPPDAQIMRQPVFIVAAAAGRPGLRRDEPADGGHAAGHAAMRPALFRRRAGAAMARDRHVRARLLHRPPDQALRRAAGHGRGAWRSTGCIAVALSGVELHTSSWRCSCWAWAGTSCSPAARRCRCPAYRPEERDKAQGALNFFVFATLALLVARSGVLVTTQGWSLLNWGSLVPVVLRAALALAMAGDAAGGWRLTAAFGRRKARSSQRCRAVEHRLGLELVEDLVVQRLEACSSTCRRVAAPRQRRRGSRPASTSRSSPA